MSHQKITLFEYGEYQKIPFDSISDFKDMLCKVWENKNFLFSDTLEILDNEEDFTKNYQPFFTFDGNKIRAKNFVGFVQWEGSLIEILPKVFKHNNLNKNIIFEHILFWLKYCKSSQFPISEVDLEANNYSSLPELILHIISKTIYEIISTQPFSQYQFIEEALPSPKGKINFNRYFHKSISYGNFHQIECDYEPYLFDNKINRLLKYVSKLIINLSNSPKTVSTCLDIQFILNEVSDEAFISKDIENLKINSFFIEYEILIKYCMLILDSEMYSNRLSNQSNWCFLMPMEKVFEDFTVGFLQQHFSKNWKIKPQDPNYFTDNGEFMMIHDVFIKNKNTNKKIIIDTKYKIRTPKDMQDKKKGVQQSDLYQMNAYSYKRSINDIILVYPNYLENLKAPTDFFITNAENTNTVNIKAIEIPFWSENVKDLEGKLKLEFENIL